jgi:dimethylhistidine N-methyltransferase
MNEFARALKEGLGRQPRAMSPKWFYDEAGSVLFERICELPEYYPTRVEFALLQRHAAEIADLIGPGLALVEFGAGATRKVRVLLSALDSPARFVPVDISGEHLLGAVERLRDDYAGLIVEPLVADFTGDMVLPAAIGPRAGFFPGSSIGNFEPVMARALLQRFARLLDGGWLLIGVDLVKDPQLLHAAYNDAAGVTAAFNLNLWVRANREADADFVIADWMHSAFYNPTLHRIEMHLVSRQRQRVSIGPEVIEFAEGDSVHTESSYKYTVEGFQQLARDAGWQPQAVWIDAQKRFSMHLLRGGEGH